MHSTVRLGALGAALIILGACASDSMDGDAEMAATAEGAKAQSQSEAANPAFAATANAGCSTGSATFDQNCAYASTRNADGSTTVEIVKPGGNPAERRALTFRGQSVGTDGIGLRSQRRGEFILVGTEDRAEFYRIPTSAIGG